MDRTDPLEDEQPLTHRGPGHAPALWLALPLLGGSLLAAQMEPAPGPLVAVGVALLALATFSAGRSPALWMAACAIAGLALGGAWHRVRAARTEPWPGERGQADLFVEVEHAEPRADDRWRMVGWVQTGPPDARRRRVQCEGAGELPAAGGLQVISGLLAPCGAVDDPREDWRRSQGISLRLSRARVAATLEPPGTWSRWMARATRALESNLAELPWEDPRGASLLAATMLGRTSLLEEGDRAAFAATGTLHLFAISGLHIAGMALALTWAMRRCRVDARLAAGGALAALWVYVEATGGAPSARRAWIMAACILACAVARRKANPVQGLAVAGALTLIADPEAAQDAGFQLSYASVAGILLVGAPACRALARPTLAERLTPSDAASRGRRAARWLRTKVIEGLCISVAATTASTAITLGVFRTLCPGGVVANLVLVPLSGPPVILGMVSVALAPFAWADGPRRLTNGLAAIWLDLMAMISEWLAALPGMSAAAHWREPWIGTATTAAVLATMLLQPRDAPGWRLLGQPLLLLLTGLLLGASLG